jgi:hypothetical protein
LVIVNGRSSRTQKSFRESRLTQTLYWPESEKVEPGSSIGKSGGTGFVKGHHSSLLIDSIYFMSRELSDAKILSAVTRYCRQSFLLRLDAFSQCYSMPSQNKA